MSSQLPKICPSCRQFNPANAVICGHCGTNMDTRTSSTTSSIDTSSMPLIVELLRDWFGIYFSLGFNLQRFTQDPRNWNKFSLDIIVVALLNGITGLLWAFLVIQFDYSAFASNMGDVLEMFSQGFSLGLDPEVNADILITGTLVGFGTTFTVTLYMIFIHYCATFFGGKGDISDLFHMSLSVSIVSAMLTPVVLLTGPLNLFLFIAVALLWSLYALVLEISIIQAVYKVNIAIAVVIHALAAGLFPCCWSMISMLGAG